MTPRGDASPPRGYPKRGSILFIPGFRFPHEKRDKYCVLLEDFAWGGDELLVVFITSNTEFQHVRTAVLMPPRVIEELPEKGVIECNNVWPIRKAHIENGRISYLGDLPPDLMSAVNAAIEKAHWQIDEVTWLRMRG